MNTPKLIKVRMCSESFVYSPMIEQMNALTIMRNTNITRSNTEHTTNGRKIRSRIPTRMNFDSDIKQAAMKTNAQLPTIKSNAN